MNPFGDQLLNVITYLPLVGAAILLVAFKEEQKELIAKVANVLEWFERYRTDTRPVSD